MFRSVWLGMVVVLAGATGAQAQLDSLFELLRPKPRPPVSVRRALIVCGHAGDAEHRELFAETVVSLRESLTTRYGVASDALFVHFGGEQIEDEEPAVAGARPAKREDLEASVAELRKALKPEDSLWVIVIGHAHYDGRRSFLNLPGPDLSHEEFGRLFAGVACREQVFFITTPVSGYFIKPLSAKGRIVITATEADLEVNETTFPHVLAATMAAPPAEFDVNADGRTSVFDLYIATVRSVQQQYADGMSLPTEHANLDDNGDGRGTESQLDYLPVEQGGRTRPEGSGPPAIVAGADGESAAQTLLPAAAAVRAPAEEKPVESTENEAAEAERPEA